jgi:MFS transporter, DHA1 family, multidrug resistance protein
MEVGGCPKTSFWTVADHLKAALTSPPDYNRPVSILRKIQYGLKTPWQRTLYIMFVAQLMTAVGFSSIFPFFPLYVHQLGSSFGFNLDLMAGLVFSAQAFTMMIASPIWGALADRYGRKLMVERAMFGGSIILLLMAFVTSSEQLVLLRAVQGLVTGTVAAANALVASATPREHAGYGMGLLQVGQGGGVALGPIIGGAVADRFGYAAAFYVTAALLLLGGILVLVGVQESAFERQKRAPASPKPGFLAAWGEIFAFPGVRITYVLQFLSQLGMNLLTPIIPLFIPTVLGPEQDLNTFTGLVIGLNAATATLSSIVLGRLGDRTGHRIILIVSMAAGGLLYFPIAGVQAGWQILALTALVGVAAGGIVPSISALQARFTRPGLEGAVYGLDSSIGSGARSLAPLIGSGIAISFSLRAAFPITGAILLLGAVISFLLLPRRQVLTGVGI